LAAGLIAEVVDMTGEKSRRYGAGLKGWLIRGVASLLIGPTATTLAQTSAPPPTYEPAPGATSAPETQLRKFTQAELEKLLAPIALYPDSLLAQMLPAAAYPLEIVQAHRWLEKNGAAAAAQDFSAADAQSWDPSVKAMLRFPTVLQKMSDDLDWTSRLGDAIINQPQEVADAIQLLRLKAQQAGALKSSNQLNVVTRNEGGRDVVFIESPDPAVIYVPQYDPVAVFAPSAGVAIAAGLLSFGAGVAVGSAWRGNYWNWNTGVFYPPVWPGYPAWRPPYSGWRPGMPGGGGNNVVIGGGGNNIGIGGRPWRPDPGHRPGGRPGAGGPIERPGPGGGGIGGVKPPGGGAGGPMGRPGPGGGGIGAVKPPGGGAGGPISLPRPGGGAILGGKPVGGLGGLPGHPGGFQGRPAPGAHPGFQGAGGHAHRGGFQGRPAHHGFQGGGGHGHHGGFGGGHGGGGRAHHGGGRRR
jgi:Protein of unknown function (DUF3300)